MSIRMSPNHREALSAISTITGSQEYLTSTGGILNTSGSGGGGNNTNANVYVNQQTAGNSATQFTGTSTLLSNGIIIKALPTNTATVYIGSSSVSATTGFPLAPGDAGSIAVSNINLMYVIGNGSDKISWIGN